MGVVDRSRFEDVARNAAAQLVSLRCREEEAFVSTPLMYAGGSYVTVRVAPSGDSKFFVSDFGMGLQEAMLSGSEIAYRRIAKGVAEKFGVGFDLSAFFVIEVSATQLPGAIAIVANASQEAVNRAAERTADRSGRDESEVLFSRLTKIFSARSVARDVTLLGASNTEWKFSSMVSVGGRRALFDSVSSSANSVVFASVKFADVARTEEGYGRFAIVRNKRALGTYLGVLSHSANVIESEVDDSVIHGLLEKAA